MEIYAFTFYTLMSNYKGNSFGNVAYKYYMNGVSATILIMLFIFIVYFNFGTPNLKYINQIVKTSQVSLVYNISSLVFLFAIILKFFLFNTYFTSVSKSKDITNLFFINILFIDIPIGIYILMKLFQSLFDMNFILNTLYLKYILYSVGTYMIINNSYKILIRKNLLSNVYSFAVITTGYILIAFGVGNSYAITSIFLFVLNHLVINFLFYILVAMLLFLFQKSETAMLYAFKKYSFIIYIILLSKLMFPIGFGFDSLWYLILSIIQKKDYYLFIPIIIEKIAMVSLLIRYYYALTQEEREGYTYLDLDNKINFRLKHVLPVAIVFILMLISTIFSKNIVETILNFSITMG